MTYPVDSTICHKIPEFFAYSNLCLGILKFMSVYFYKPWIATFYNFLIAFYDDSRDVIVKLVWPTYPIYWVKLKRDNFICEHLEHFWVTRFAGSNGEQNQNSWMKMTKNYNDIFAV